MFVLLRVVKRRKLLCCNKMMEKSLLLNRIKFASISCIIIFSCSERRISKLIKLMPENLNQQRCLRRFYLMRHVVRKGEFLYKMKKVLAFGLRKIFSKNLNCRPNCCKNFGQIFGVVENWYIQLVRLHPKKMK